MGPIECNSCGRTNRVIDLKTGRCVICEASDLDTTKSPIDKLINDTLDDIITLSLDLQGVVPEARKNPFMQSALIALRHVLRGDKSRGAAELIEALDALRDIYRQALTKR